MTAEASVLVVDDNRVIADTYAAFLADEYTVETVYGGEAALDALGPEVEVVLLDRRMPGLSGDEVLARIDERALDCRVVMVTAVDPAVDVVDLPFDEYVVKPVGRPELVAVVEEMRRRATYDDALRGFLALASKKATLEARVGEAERADSEPYRRVEERLAEKRESLGIETERLEGIVSGEARDIVTTSDTDAITE
ncbi:response regulator receiver protein [Halosimplex carlsbadense 2-9-1]|uniref:Response regulator receiver protein n=1 Tax=Halosimplex carlsbadense 2-9-1 TaxID=797114 RepID=M0CRD2_9EURY|nr:response regulator [Halosimplex carlsbadense]ELZ24947.1 response regulator receiver protein [Halosimplex carlsbadense 2-9-1]